MGIGDTIYNLCFKRTSSYALTVICATFFFERAYEVTVESLFDRINEGKLWKHIKHNYES